MENKSVVIIGAGPAGLTAAYRLLERTDIKLTILEENDFVGGISRTANYKNNRIDIGGHRFFTKNEEVMELWKSLMPIQGSPAWDDIIIGRTPTQESGPDPEKEDRVFLKRRRVSRIYFLKKFFDYPVSIKPETFINMGLKRTVIASVGYLASIIKKRRENSLEDFYINRFGRPLYEMFFENYTEKLWGVHPSKIAPDWGAQRVKGLSLFKVVISVIAKPFIADKNKETSLIEEFYYPKHGPGQLWEAMAAEIEKMGGRIILNQSVDRIDFEDGGGVKLRSTGGDGSLSEYRADSVFSSMPVKDLIQAMGDAPAEEIRRIAADLPYRDFITVGLLVNKLKIKNETKVKTAANIVPDCWIYVQERDVTLGRIQIFNNWSPYMVADPENTVWIGLEYFCNEGDEKWRMQSEDFIEFAIGELENIGVIDKADVLDSTIIRVKKAYPAYFGSYNQFDTVRMYLASFGNLYCIGRNGQHRYNNMDHSMLTAIEAVECYIGGGAGKERVWNVNTEEEYHETKSGQGGQANGRPN